MQRTEEQKRNARNRRINYRKNMRHFGAAKDKDGIDPNVTIYTTTDVFIESPFSKQTDATESLLKNMEKTRMKRSMKKAQSVIHSVTDNRYVPPGQRDGADKKMAYGAKMIEKDLHTLRVTNISLETTEDEIGDLFSRFGRLTRVKLMVDYRGNGNFAFISFSSKVDALEAMTKLQSYGLNHSILKIDTAVQKKRNNW